MIIFYLTCNDLKKKVLHNVYNNVFIRKCFALRAPILNFLRLCILFFLGKIKLIM